MSGLSPRPQKYVGATQMFPIPEKTYLTLLFIISIMTMGELLVRIHW